VDSDGIHNKIWMFGDLFSESSSVSVSRVGDTNHLQEILWSGKQDDISMEEQGKKCIRILVM